LLASDSFLLLDVHAERRGRACVAHISSKLQEFGNLLRNVQGNESERTRVERSHRERCAHDAEEIREKVVQRGQFQLSTTAIRTDWSKLQAHSMLFRSFTTTTHGVLWRKGHLLTQTSYQSNVRNEKGEKVGQSGELRAESVFFAYEPNHSM